MSRYSCMYLVPKEEYEAMKDGLDFSEGEEDGNERGRFRQINNIVEVTEGSNVIIKGGNEESRSSRDGMGTEDVDIGRNVKFPKSREDTKVHSKQPLALKRRREAEQLQPTVIHPHPHNLYSSSSRASSSVRGKRRRSTLPYSLSSLGGDDVEDVDGDASMRTASRGRSNQSASSSSLSSNRRSDDVTMRSYYSSAPSSSITNPSRGMRRISTSSSTTTDHPSSSRVRTQSASSHSGHGDDNGRVAIVTDGDEPMSPPRRPTTSGSKGKGKRVSLNPRLEEIIQSRLERLRGEKRKPTSRASTTSSAASSTRRPPPSKKNKSKHVIVDFPIGKRKLPFYTASARKKRRHYDDDNDNDEADIPDTEV